MSSNSNNMNMNSTNTNNDKQQQQQQKKPMFPWLLHNLLNEADDKGFSHVVSWNPSGKSFKVHDREVFINDILPRYVSQTKYKSFVRQLNMWGFSCIHGGRKAPERGSYRHDNFIRGHPGLCANMKRIKIKGTAKARGKAKAGTTPNASSSQQQRNSASQNAPTSNANVRVPQIQQQQQPQQYQQPIKPTGHGDSMAPWGLSLPQPLGFSHNFRMASISDKSLEDIANIFDSDNTLFSNQSDNVVDTLLVGTDVFADSSKPNWHDQRPNRCGGIPRLSSTASAASMQQYRAQQQQQQPQQSQSDPVLKEMAQLIRPPAVSGSNTGNGASSFQATNIPSSADFPCPDPSSSGFTSHGFPHDPSYAFSIGDTLDSLLNPANGPRRTGSAFDDKFMTAV